VQTPLGQRRWRLQLTRRWARATHRSNDCIHCEKARASTGTALRFKELD
jgi:hypothetical protein